MRVTSKGQITIPQAVRERAGLRPGSEVEFALGEDGAVILRRAGAQPRSEALELAIGRLRGAARGRGPGLSTEEMMALTRGCAAGGRTVAHEASAA